MHTLTTIGVCLSSLVTLGVGLTWATVAAKTTNRYERIAGAVGASNVAVTAAYAISQVLS